MSKRWCFFIPADAYDEGKGYVPSVVYEGEPGHSPLRGDGPHAEPWHWGMTYEQAKEFAQRANAEMGLSKESVAEIVASSMAATRRAGDG
jgi:hypothetical protein